MGEVVESPMSRGFHRLMQVVGVVVFALAIFFVRKLLHRYSLNEILSDVQQISRQRLMLSLLTTLTAYMLLTCYDGLAFATLNKPLSRLKIMFTSFVAYGFGNTIGMANFAGSSVRLRLYTRWGLRAKDVLQIIIFCSVSFWLGFVALAAVIFCWQPPRFDTPVRISPVVLQLVGALFALLILGYFILCLRRTRVWRVWSLELPIPPLKIAVAQIVVAALDWVLAALAMFWLLPPVSGLNFLTFLGLYVGAQLVALMSHVPGGVGVLEAMIVIALQSYATENLTSQIVAALLVYRAIYYLLPLTLSFVLMLMAELHQHWQHRLTR
jgi:uncharacterized membrane protein YbhN (UPF0104 family)